MSNSKSLIPPEEAMHIEDLLPILEETLQVSSKAHPSLQGSSSKASTPAGLRQPTIHDTSPKSPEPLSQNGLQLPTPSGNRNGISQQTSSNARQSNGLNQLLSPSSPTPIGNGFSKQTVSNARQGNELNQLLSPSSPTPIGNGNGISQQTGSNTSQRNGPNHSPSNSSPSHGQRSPFQNETSPPRRGHGNGNFNVRSNSNFRQDQRFPPADRRHRQNWQSWPSIQLKFSLEASADPPRAADFLPLFNQFGRVREINRSLGARRPVTNGHPRNGQMFDLTVLYMPPPKVPFWETWAYRDFNCRFTGYCLPHFAFGKVKLPSSTFTQTKFRDEAFHAKSLTFGQMKNADTFVREWSTRNDSEVLFLFKFGDRRFEIEFTHDFHITDKEPQRETYKFQYEFRNITTRVEAADTWKPTVIFKAETPAAFWRKRATTVKDVEAQNDDEYKEWELWNRAIAIRTKTKVEPSKRFGMNPVAVMNRKETENPHVLNFGKWRVYRVSFDFAGNPQMRKIFQEAIRFLAVFTDMTLPTYTYTMPRYPPPPFVYDHLPFDQLYMIESLVSKDILNEYNLSQDFVRALESAHPQQALRILEQMHDNAKPIYEPLAYLQSKLDQLKTANVQGDGRPKLPAHCVMTRRAVITPTRIVLHPPTLEVTNRVTRHYKNNIDSFLRITFSDEADRLRYADDKALDPLFTRVHDALREGLRVGQRKYELLSASSSQLKEHSCWFYDAAASPSAESIRKWMGDFTDIKVPAKLLARLGQAFSTTKPVMSVNKIVDIPDIAAVTDAGKKYLFSDGIGKIGHDLLLVCHQQIDDDNEQPIAFQFRMGGAKGMLAYWPDISPDEVHVRPSQVKFKSEHTTLEVCRGSTFKTSFLNRQVITVLNTALGIPNHVFTKIQEEEVEKLSQIDTSRDAALRFIINDIDVKAGAREMLRQALESGFLEHGDIVITNIMRLLKAWRLREIKAKARVPIARGAFLFGVLDESGVLDENEIFVQIKRPGGEFEVIEAECILYRSPCIHPGDVRVVKAKGDKLTRDKLDHLYNVIVFPQRGPRDLASQCGGGDLDGDDFNVIWEPSLIPPNGHVAPMDYDAKTGAKEVTKEIKMWQVAKFMTNYFKDNNLGTIANNYLAIADHSAHGSLDKRCIRLAELHSDAVDFAKTGVSAEFLKELKRDSWPDFMEKREKSHPSYRALGLMYRAINLVTYKPERSQDHMDRRVRLKSELSVSVDEFQIGQSWDGQVQKWISAARDLKREYDREIAKLQNKYEVATEYEIVTSVIVAAETGDNELAARTKKKEIRYERKEWDMREEIDRLFGEIRINMRQKIIKIVLGDDAVFGQGALDAGIGDWADDALDPAGSMGSSPNLFPELPKRKGVAALTLHEKQALAPFVIAMYRVTYGPQMQVQRGGDDDAFVEDLVVNGQSRFTFPWLFHEVLCYVVRTAMTMERQKGEEIRKPSRLQAMAGARLGRRPESVLNVIPTSGTIYPIQRSAPILAESYNLGSRFGVIDLDDMSDDGGSDGSEEPPNFY